MNFNEKKDFLVNFTFTAVITALIFFVSKFMLAYLFPFIIGVVLSFVMQRPSAFISRKTGIKKGICSAILVTATYVLVTAVVILLIWTLISAISGMAGVTADYLKSAAGMFESLLNSFKKMAVLLPKSISGTVDNMAHDFSENISEKFTAFLSGIATTTAKNLPAFLISSIVTVVASFYIVKDFDKIKKFFKNFLKPTTYKNVVVIKDIVQKSILQFVLGYLLLMGITFVEMSIGLIFLRIKYAVLVAAVISLIDLLPVLGTGTVIIPWSVISFLSKDTSRGFGLLILYIIITVVRNFSEPRIIGNRVGINPLLTLITMFVGLKISGIAGMIFLPVIFIVVITFYKNQLYEEKII
ncbi:MAG: sporulation integral membrane protein YtvI [Clostridia bacterium]|nr:sporulation integral membrane protein YtvI [Clostridia bacterium]